MNQTTAAAAPTTAAPTGDALIERVVASTIALFDLTGLYLGQRLGLYRALRDGGPATSDQLAEATGTDERYAREWLEQQAVTGLLVVDDATAGARERRFSLPEAYAEPLVDADSPSYIAPLARQALGMLRPLPQLVDAFRTGEGIPYPDYGDDTREGIAELNRAMFINDLGPNWFGATPALDSRLRSPSGARVADLGCGTGWSSIAIARAYPHAVVDGFDLDAASIGTATANAADEGLEDRVRFFVRDASDPGLEGGYDIVTIFEALHDMARPVEALAAARRLLTDGGMVIVADERVAEHFAAPGDDLERLMYGYSVVHCLAVGRADHDTPAATGTVMRPDKLRAYAGAAGFRGVETLPIENDFWRFYRLDP
jgi:2-polyprenyl-3-methyl-5-hydroxy-6-metoxy-1,4-benzoquinol methylase